MNRFASPFANPFLIPFVNPFVNPFVSPPPLPLPTSYHACVALWMIIIACHLGLGAPVKCIFSTVKARLGKEAMLTKTGTRCLWCVEGGLAKSLANPSMKRRVQTSLNKFIKHGAEDCRASRVGRGAPRTAHRAFAWL